MIAAADWLGGRVEANGDRVRVVRGFRRWEIARDQLAAVHRSARHTPAALVLTDPDRPTSGRTVVLGLPPRLAPRTGHLPLPGFITAAAVAALLDLPLLTAHGHPIPDPLALEFRHLRTRAGAMTWLLTLMLAVLLGFLAVVAWSLLGR